MVKRVSERIIEASGSERLQSMDWKFHVIEAPGVANAFVLPGSAVEHLKSNRRKSFCIYRNFAYHEK